MAKTALITGITGQDGSYLAELLLAKGYAVHGLVRRTSSTGLARIQHLPALHLHAGDLADAHSLRTIVERVEPHEVYHLAGQSHVRQSFDEAAHTADVTGVGTLRVLEALRGWRARGQREVRFYQAGSSEMFGTSPPRQSESTPFRPRSPYGCAKVFAHHATVMHREAHGLFAVNGILFNHESPRRSEEFATRKVTRAAARIKLGLESRLALGNLDARRDWGYAPEYVEAMWRMLQAERPDDYVVATGVSHALSELVELAFAHLDLDWRDHVDIDVRLYRPAEVDHLEGDASKARTRLAWEPRTTFRELVALMVDHDVALAEREIALREPGVMTGN